MSIVPNSLNQITELTQGNQIGSGVKFDLSDDTFANILGDRLNKMDDVGEVFTQLMGPIGVPVGLNIEGLTDDPFKVSAINPSELGELALNQSEINGNDENVLKSSGLKMNDFLKQLDNGSGSVSITDAIGLSKSKNTVKAMLNQDSYSNGLGNFVKKQAANLYGTMNKTVASSINDLLSAM